MTASRQFNSSWESFQSFVDQSILPAMGLNREMVNQFDRRLLKANRELFEAALTTLDRPPVSPFDQHVLAANREVIKAFIDVIDQRIEAIAEPEIITVVAAV